MTFMPPQYQTDPNKKPGQIINNPIGHILSEIEEFLCVSTELKAKQILKTDEQAICGKYQATGTNYPAQNKMV
jgi:hypothetical protein